mmetsp:Transcript_16386/g.14314  ORF Transcript_16386/g.14314 Transcript_16386/m.14314 type:complete len:90 (-) Transcript_16386:1236-1505(-)
MTKILRIDIEKAEKIALEIKEKYRLLLSIRQDEEDFERENVTPALTNFPSSKDSILYKYAYLSQIENDSNNPFPYCSECQSYKLPRMEH